MFVLGGGDATAQVVDVTSSTDRPATRRQHSHINYIGGSVTTTTLQFVTLRDTLNPTLSRRKLSHEIYSDWMRNKL